MEKGTSKIWLYEDFRISDDAGGCRAFVALEWTVDRDEAVKHLGRNSDQGATIKRERHDFFGTVYVARDADGQVLGRVRQVEAV